MMLQLHSTQFVMKVISVLPINPFVDCDKYHEYIAGAMTALFGAYLQGNILERDYLTGNDQIPFKIRTFSVDVKC